MNKNKLAISQKNILSKILKCFLIVCIFFSFNFANAETQKERIERLQKAVIFKENGDVIIPFDRNNVPDTDFSEIIHVFKQAFLPVIYQIAPDLDYDNLAKALKKADLDHWEKIPAFLGKYLRKELKTNVKYIEETKFNPKKIRELIDKGIIPIVRIKKFSKSNNDIFDLRNKSREGLYTKEELFENLNKHQVDLKLEKFKEGATFPGAMIAYNKYTKEFCYTGGGTYQNQLWWYTEEELSKSFVGIRYYELLP